MAMARPKLSRPMSSAMLICGMNRPKDWRTPMASVTISAADKTTIQGRRMDIPASPLCDRESRKDAGDPDRKRLRPAPAPLPIGDGHGRTGDATKELQT